MQKSLIFGIVVLAIVGLLFALSIDDDPPDDTHLVPPERPLADADANGYTELVRLLELLEWPEDDAWIHELPRDRMHDNADILALLETNEAALALVPDAAAAPKFRVPASTDLESPTVLAPARHLGELVALDATIRMTRGDTTGAFEILVRYLALAHRFHSTGELIHYLIGNALQERALQNIVTLAADADGDGLENVAASLSDFAWERESMEGALRREYVFMTDMIDQPFEDAGWRKLPVLAGYLYQPNRTRELYIESFAAAIDGLGEDCATAPREAEEVTMEKWRFLAPNSIGRILYTIGVPDLERFTFSRCREQMSVGLTRLVLATRAYRADNGRLPENLDALVPRYLSELPRDVDGQSFRYSAVGEYLYSVGGDRLDDGGGEPTLEVDWNDPDPGVSLRR